MAGTALGCQKTEVTENDVKRISLVELRTLLDSKDSEKVLILDPRYQGDFAQGHIDGASNIPLTAAASKSGQQLNPEIERYPIVVVYGLDPASPVARAMAQRLMVLGHDDVRWFPGGLSEWRNAGLRVTGVEADKSTE